MRHHKQRIRSRAKAMRFIVERTRKHYAKGKDSITYAAFPPDQLAVLRRALAYLNISAEITAVKQEGKHYHKLTFKE